ncbi:hypothetical protein Tco_0560223, partial [Tanacetum coccineum]
MELQKVFIRIAKSKMLLTLSWFLLVANCLAVLGGGGVAGPAGSPV